MVAGREGQVMEENVVQVAVYLATFPPSPATQKEDVSGSVELNSEDYV